jgi:actin-related protein
MITTFNNSENVNIIEPVPIIISGGTTLPNGFIELFKSELDKQSVPFDYTDIIPAKERLTAVSKGCLLMADNI